MVEFEVQGDALIDLASFCLADTFHGFIEAEESGKLSAKAVDASGSCRCKLVALGAKVISPGRFKLDKEDLTTLKENMKGKMVRVQGGSGKDIEIATTEDCLVIPEESTDLEIGAMPSIVDGRWLPRGGRADIYYLLDSDDVDKMSKCIKTSKKEYLGFVMTAKAPNIVSGHLDAKNKVLQKELKIINSEGPGKDFILPSYFVSILKSAVSKGEFSLQTISVPSVPVVFYWTNKELELVVAVTEWTQPSPTTT